MTHPFRKALQGLAPYPPGKPVEEVQREFGLKSVVKLASNENPIGPSPLALKAIVEEVGQLNVYPESGCHYLRQKLAARLNVPPEWLLFGNGSDEVVALLAMAFLEPGDNIVCSDLAFIRYEMGATSMGADTIHVPVKNWRHDVDGFLKAVNDKTQFVFFANPDNPVGTSITAADVERLLNNIPSSVMVVIDEAYYEFACEKPDYPRSLDYLREKNNVIVLRTFSKAYGLAGLRLGYGVARPWVWDAVDRVRPPFNVNRLAQAGAMAAMDDTEHLRKTIETNDTGKAYLYAELATMGIEYIPTDANFILMNLSRPAGPVFDALLRLGVITRPMGMYKLPDFLRVSIGLPHENEVFCDSLRRVLSSRPE
jgi:histidinol-phosphate aminotransferase